MTEDTGAAVVSPDEAFGALGNETRIEILRVLGRADGPLPFSELQDRVGTRDSGQFNYHLDKLVGHFVRRTDEGYELRRPGERVLEAVLSGAVTEDPTVEPTEVDFDCLFCGAPVELNYRQEHIELYCTECAGQYGESTKTRESVVSGKHGHLGGFQLPPAGIHDRTPEEMLAAGSAWSHLDLLSTAYGICPRCSAVVDHEVIVCEDHDAAGGLCPQCDQRHAVRIHNRCTNCIYETRGVFTNHLIGSHELRSFVSEHGIDPVRDGVEWGWGYEEDVVSTDPFEARFTITIDDDSITLTVDDSLTVANVAVTRG